MISQSTIDTVFETARVEEVIGDFVQLKRAGSNLKGLSPFANEKSPSFMVSPVKQIWKDFSSGKGGNAVTFIMEHEHFSFPEAIRYLAKKYNIEIEETVPTDEALAEANEKESLYLISEFAQVYFNKTLLNTDEGQAIGLSYFKERGFTNDTIKKFGLGYSPETRDAFTKEALGQGYKIEYLEKTGLTILREDGTSFDRFKGRVMFPIQSMSGRVLGFGGRILSNDKKVAKYLNSPESDIYHKSKVLYGLYHAKQSIAKKDNCFLCEGYTDVIQMHQAGIENVVSSSGTALTVDQIKLINRLTKNITVLFDGDAAGLRASIRGIDLILEEGMNVKVCTFPDGEDPDSFARKTPIDELNDYLENNSKDFIQFKASLLMNEAKNDPIKKAELIRDMVNSISKIPDRIKREVYIQECSRIMDISEEVLFNTLAQLVKKDLAEANKQFKQEQKAFDVVKSEPQVTSKVDIQFELEQKLIEILLLYGNIETEFDDYVYVPNEEGELKEIKETHFQKVYQRVYLSLQEDETELANPTFQAIYTNLINYFNQTEKFEFEQYLMQLPPELSQEVTTIIMNEERVNLHNWEARQIYVKQKDQTISQYVTETILSLRWFLVNKIIEEIKNSLSTEKESDHTESLYMVMDYTKLIGNFSSKLGRVMSRYS